MGDRDAGVESAKGMRGEGPGGEEEGDEVDVAGCAFCWRTVQCEVIDDVF